VGGRIFCRIIAGRASDVWHAATSSLVARVGADETCREEVEVEMDGCFGGGQLFLWAGGLGKV
jgi:hypothetical protein